MASSNAPSMRALVEALPEQWKDALARARRWRLPARVRRPGGIVVVGMGGSAVGGDLLLSVFQDQLTVPVVVRRHYRLPAWVGPSSLVCAVSYSGNTEETLSAYAEARRRGARLCVVTSGGKLASLAARDRVPCAIIPAGYPPRAALAYLFHPLVRLAQAAGGVRIRETEMDAVQATLRQVVREGLTGKPVKRMAARLASRPVLIMANETLAGVAWRWKTQFNENAKSLAYAASLPELHHNEIVGWKKGGSIRQLAVVALRMPDDEARVKLRFDITRTLARDTAHSYDEVWARGTSRIARVFSLIAYGDCVSVALAEAHRVEATPVRVIDALKRQLTQSRRSRA